MKKAMELAILCNCEIGLILFDSNNRLYEFKSDDMRRIIRKYSDSKPQESFGKEDLFRRYFMKDTSNSMKGAFARKLENERNDQAYVENEDSDSDDDLRISKESSTRFRGTSNRPNESRTGQSPFSGNSRKERVATVPEKDIMMMESVEPVFSNAGWGSMEQTDPSLCSRAPNCSYPEGLALGGQPNFAPYNDPMVKKESNLASQQILHIEDIPPYVVSLSRQNKSPMCGPHFRSNSLDRYPHQDNAIGTSTMRPSASELLENQQAQRLATPMLAANGGVHSRSASCPVYLLHNNETRKLLDKYEPNRTCPPPQHFPVLSDPASTGILPHVELAAGIRPDQGIPGSFFACPHAGDQVPYPYISEQLREAHLPRVSQEDLVLQRLLHNTPNYKYPHCSNANQP